MALRRTSDADVVSLKVGLEVFGARLRDRVHRGDEQRAVLAVVTGVADVGRDVSVTAHHVTVVHDHVTHLTHQWTDS